MGAENCERIFKLNSDDFLKKTPPVQGPRRLGPGLDGLRRLQGVRLAVVTPVKPAPQMIAHQDLAGGSCGHRGIHG